MSAAFDLPDDMPVRVRHLATKDWPWVAPRWERAHSKAFHVCATCAHARIKAIVARPTSITLMLCDPDAPDVLWGFACYEPATMHFVFVKEALRGMGLGRKLFASIDAKDSSHPCRGFTWHPERAWT